VIFKQLFEPVSCTYSYLLGCDETRACVIIDPVIETAERDVGIIQTLGLKLEYTLETHIHADHLTGALKLKHLAGSRICAAAMDGLPCVDVGIREGEILRVGAIEIHPLFTPGHTDTHHCYRVDNGAQTMLFSGDALLIEACGRTDFQSGDAATLYRSIHDKLFSLPDETLVYPGHDYEGRFVSSIAQEKVRNPRLGKEIGLDAFVALMDGLELSPPRKMAFAVPGNRLCGVCPPDVPDELKGPCDFIEHQG
jgi:glyoxylase-like metal-dependent hydrolase (beta-lactamase superfamily II)